MGIRDCHRTGSPVGRWPVRLVIVLAGLAVALPGTVGAAGATSASAATSLAADDPVAIIAAAYRSADPGLTTAQARTAALGSDARRQLYDRLAATDSAVTFGGAWYDPHANIVHITVTTAGAEATVAAAAAELTVPVLTHRVRLSFGDLETTAAQMRTDLAGITAGQVGIDVQRNEVLVRVPAEPAATRPVVADVGCTTRAACDSSIRAGTMLWRGGAGNRVCSVGFTGRTGAGVRYTLTAGHCSTGNQVIWGTGAVAIGPMTTAVDEGPLDVALIRVSTARYTDDPGGQIFRTLRLNAAATSLSTLVAGETVCLSANFTRPSGPVRCGVIGSVADPDVRGMVRVDGVDACPGDSGGGWFALTSTGSRIGVGLHSRSLEGCNVAGGQSWFSPLPSIRSGVSPQITIETR